MASQITSKSFPLEKLPEKAKSTICDMLEGPIALTDAQRMTLKEMNKPNSNSDSLLSRLMDMPGSGDNEVDFANLMPPVEARNVDVRMAGVLRRAITPSKSSSPQLPRIMIYQPK